MQPANRLAARLRLRWLGASVGRRGACKVEPFADNDRAAPRCDAQRAHTAPCGTRSRLRPW